MNSNLFDMFGLNIDIAYILIPFLILIIVLFILVIRQAGRIKSMTERIDNITRGKDASSLEDEIFALFEDNDFIKKETEKNRKNIDNIYN